MKENPEAKDNSRGVVFPATLYYWLQGFLNSEIFTHLIHRGHKPEVLDNAQKSDETNPDRTPGSGE